MSPEPYRGSTFSPATSWHSGSIRQQADFALKKLEDVADFLWVLAKEADEVQPRCFFRKRGNPQRVYDLVDASRTIRDARFALKQERSV